MAAGSLDTLGRIANATLDTCNPGALAAAAVDSSPPVDHINTVTVYTGFIVLLLSIMDGVLDRSVPYQMVWVGSPMLLLLYAAGLPAWILMADLMRRGGVDHSTEDKVLFAFFTITIVWLYFKQFTIMWDLLWDWELFLAVAWARCLVARQRPPGTAAAPAEVGYLARVRVLASRGFPPFPQWRGIWHELRAGGTILRWLQCVPLLVVGICELPVVLIFGISAPMARLFVWARTRGGHAAFHGPSMAVVNVRVDLSTVLPRTPAWGLWAFAQAHSEESATGALMTMTDSANPDAARTLAVAATGMPVAAIYLAGPAPPVSNRQLLLTTVIVLANSAVNEWDWEGAAMSPARQKQLEELWAAHLIATAAERV